MPDERARRWTRRLQLILVPVVLIGCRGGIGRRETIPPVGFDPAPIVAREVRLARPISPEADGAGFARAATMGFDGDRMLVLEIANSRLVIFDSTFRPIATIGRPGAGPGELRGVLGLAVWNGEYAITEVNNGRISVFARDGTFRRVIPLPNGFTEVGYAPDGALYVSAYDQRDYLLAIDRDGIARPFAERPWELYSDDVLSSTLLPGGPVKFAVTDSGTVHVYDAELGALIKYSPGGRRLAARRLPSPVIDWLTERSALVMKDFGGSARNARPRVTGLSATDDGRLLLTFPAKDGMFGLLVEAASYRTRPLRWASGTDPQLAGFAGVVHRGRFYRLGSDDVRVFQLEPEGPAR
jgi:hypothetical protein